MPFEREDTTLAEFEFCDPCLREYRRPGDRRFHAQTTACPKCGPQLWSVDGVNQRSIQGEGAMLAALAALQAGKIVALRGLGGYQLLVDATNQAAAQRLRARKGRPAKPLAVMVDSMETALRLATVDEVELNQLASAAAPIVLLRAKSDNGLAESIHPNLDTVGLMAPTTPLHAMLTRDFGRPLVCTSGNYDGEPLEYEVESAQHKLNGICDLWLHHDRAIVRPIDDSVVRVIAGRAVTIRLARGLAPLPLDLPAMTPTLAVGGYLKAAAAWSNGGQAVLGPHIGDQENLAARNRFTEHIDDWQTLYRFQPLQLAHDFHPEYFSTQWAHQKHLPLIATQHHHAHVVSGMLEHGWLDREVLGVAWDGTGYGTDGTIWGGEFLVSTCSDFERLARLRPFRLPGGEAAIHEPWRIALAMCEQLEKPLNVSLLASWDVTSNCISLVRHIINRPHLSPLTSSVGRLFDAAAAIILGMTRAHFDGQAAMQLEAAADRSAQGWYDFPLREDRMFELDWRPLLEQLLADWHLGVDPGKMAMRFHRSLALAIPRVCRLRSDLPVVLSGGVFQNRLLTELVLQRWHDPSQPLGLPGIIPPNDGGLAAGQLAIAAAKGNWLSCA
jgi:hydrogenase maturation protein HypF